MSSNVWKIGSRWSDTGTKESSIIDVFRKHQIVFIGGDETDRFQVDVKIGDYLAIADGLSINTLAKVTSNPKMITAFGIDFSDEEKTRFHYEDWVFGVKVNIVELKDVITCTRGKFFKAIHLRETVIAQYEKNLNRFEIEASTKRLDDFLTLKTKYIIPIYQRPYSWTKSHIDKLLNDLFLGYYNNGIKIYEDVFIGTMQLSAPKYISNNLSEIEIIDGQQRISTFLLLIKVIQLKTENQTIKNISLNWLSTEVNNNTLQAYLKELINISKIDDLIENTSNIYIKNAFYINEKLDELFAQDDESEDLISIEDFLLEYIYKKVCFVVIQTQAPLSKTLKIFDAINTTGMDLGGNDIFKIRFYEYLKDYQNEDKNVFEKISALYSKIDEINKDGWKFGFYDILLNYQWILISKYELNKTLYNYSANTFFEQLFDVILKINNHINFDSTKISSQNIQISIEDLNVLIDNRVRREVEKDKSIEITCANHLIAHWSRYGRYWQLIMLFYYSFSKEENFEEKLNEFTEELQKTIVVYSVSYDKAVNEMHTILRNLVDLIIKDKNLEEIFIQLKNMRKGYETRYTEILNGEIFHNAKKKNLICRTSSMLDELELNSNIEPVELGGKIFLTQIDIEHIHSKGDGLNNEEKLNSWGGELNSLGNLMILESNINKSISNKPFSEKLKRYTESKYKTVEKMHQNNRNENEWTKDLALKRKEVETEKLRKYYF